MKINRNIVTPFISLIFVVVAITGMLMLFHLWDGYTEVLHEVLGLLFVFCAAFHILLNWKSLRGHFKKGVFLPAALAVLVLSAILVVAEITYPPVDLQIMERLTKAPVEDALKALGVDYTTAATRLQQKGVSLEEIVIFEDLWRHHDMDAEEVIDMLLE
ncbi:MULTISPECIES: DUF4405 domain-containing protein [Sphingobacterium]|uniref:Flavinylation-associated cytochrome domain-containing protein n=1 Tax=Sphingobacterium thermophilum TaxID=768534 RepID=A0ABP8R877_9SPHI|nr:DUF4405 domain-containing protein [Sphingobacterium sp. T2]